MHIKAKNSISQTMEIISCIPTYLGKECYEMKELIEKMSREIDKGNTFDDEFFLDAELYLKDTLEDCYSTWRMEHVSETEDLLQKLYYLQYRNEQILKRDVKNIELMEFGDNGLRTIILSTNPVQDASLPTAPFAEKKRRGVLLQMKKILPEYQTSEVVDKLKKDEISTSDIGVEDKTVGLWFHSTQSITTLINMLNRCMECLKTETGNQLKKQIYDLESKHDVVQKYMELSSELEALEKHTER